MENINTRDRGLLLTVRGVADRLGVAEGQISEAMAKGRLHHDVTGCAGWRVIPLFHPASVERIRRKLARIVSNGDAVSA